MNFAFVTPLPCGTTTLRQSHQCTASLLYGGSRKVPLMTMQGTNLSRRELMIRALATVGAMTVGPLAAYAKSGDAPTISIFGVGGQSSPFTAGIKRGGKKLYKPYNEDDMALFGKIINESKARLDGAEQSIKDKVWEDVKSRIRLKSNDLRRAQVALIKNLADAKERKDAEENYKKFKQHIQALDYAITNKNQGKAFKAYTDVQKSFASWRQNVGF